MIPEIIYNQLPQEFFKDARVMPRQHCLNTVVINENWEYPNTEIFKDISIYLKNVILNLVELRQQLIQIAIFKRTVKEYVMQKLKYL